MTATIHDLFGMYTRPAPENSRFICTMPPAKFQEPYGGTCGQVLGHNQSCPGPHAYRPVPFSLRVANGDHLSRVGR